MSNFGIPISALNFFQTRMEVSAHNVANSTTPGFRRARVDAADVAGGGVRVDAVSQVLTPPTLEVTDRPLDVTIESSAFFAVETPSGTAYTRAGSLFRDAAGQLTSPQGYPLVPPVIVPLDATGVTIGRDGTVEASFADGSQSPVGLIEVTEFPAPRGLSSASGNVLEPTPASGSARPAANPVIRSGVREGSNVDFVQEAVDQIVSRIGFQANAAAFSVMNENEGTLLEIVS